jgi:hypothetical protein
LRCPEYGWRTSWSPCPAPCCGTSIGRPGQPLAGTRDCPSAEPGSSQAGCPPLRSTRLPCSSSSLRMPAKPSAIAAAGERCDGRSGVAKCTPRANRDSDTQRQSVGCPHRPWTSTALPRRPASSPREYPTRGNSKGPALHHPGAPPASRTCGERLNVSRAAACVEEQRPLLAVPRWSPQGCRPARSPGAVFWGFPWCPACETLRGSIDGMLWGRR